MLLLEGLDHFGSAFTYGFMLISFNINMHMSAATFCIFGLFLTFQLETIGKRICDVSLLQPDVNGLLQKLNMQYVLVYQALKELENYFQNVLLLVISCIFVGSINYSVYLYNSIIEQNYKASLSPILSIMTRWFLLEAICYVAHRMKIAVVYIALRIQRVIAVETL